MSEVVCRYTKEVHGIRYATRSKLLVPRQTTDKREADVLLKDASIRALGKAPRRNHMANFTWMQNEKALNEEKRDFLNHPDDFISISRHSGHRIEDFIQSWLDNRGPNFFIKVCPDSYYLHSRMRWGSNADDSIAFLEDCGGTQKD